MNSTTRPVSGNLSGAFMFIAPRSARILCIDMGEWNSVFINSIFDLYSILSKSLEFRGDLEEANYQDFNNHS